MTLTIRAKSDRRASVNQPAVRAQIIESAEKLIHLQGWGKTTVADIARQAQMSPANVYRFFESKAQLSEAIVEKQLTAHEIQTKSILNQTSSASSRLRALLLAIHAFAKDRYLRTPGLHRLYVKASDEEWDVVKTHRRANLKSITTLVQEGIDRREFSEVSAELASANIHNAMTPYFHVRLVAERFSSDELVEAERLVDFLIGALTK